MRSGTRVGEDPGARGSLLSWRFWISTSHRATLVLIHGLGEHAGRYESLAGLLAERGISVFSFDLRGHGRSQGRRGDLLAFQDFLGDLHRMESVLSRVCSQERISPEPRFLFGHSLGALVAIRRLQESGPKPHGYRGAVISAPWLATPVPPWLKAVAGFLGRTAPSLPLPTGLSPKKLTRDPEKAREWRDDPRVHTRMTGRLFRAVEEAQSLCLDQGDALQGLPMLFLVPEEDPVVSSAVTLEFVQGIDDEAHRVEILKGRMHEALNDLGREEVYGILRSWFRAHGAPA